MKCVICGGVVNQKEVEEKIVVGNDIFFITLFITLLTEVCTGCGERYYTDTIMDKLSKLKKQLAKSQKKILPVGTVYRVSHPI